MKLMLSFTATPDKCVVQPPVIYTGDVLNDVVAGLVPDIDAKGGGRSWS